MQPRALILYIPVVHTWYLSFLKRHVHDISHVYLIPENLVQELSEIKPDIASISAEETQTLLESLGHSNVSVFTVDDVAEIAREPLLFLNDKLSRAFHGRYFKNSDVEWENVFLRWDKDSIHTAEPNTYPESIKEFDQQMILQAEREAQKSSDWWRQVGAVLVKDGKSIGAACNEALPSDYTPYQHGAVRDFLEPGASPELVDTIHAEQKLIAESAKEGRSLKGASIYITHFPCPVCAKLIIFSGISHCYFKEGWSSLQSGVLLQNAGVSLSKVILPAQ